MITLPALKVVGPEDWAGERGALVLGQIQALIVDVREVFDGWKGFHLEQLEGRKRLPNVDVVSAAISFLEWRLSWLELDNLLRTTFYGEAVVPWYQVVDDFLWWTARELDLPEADFARLEQQALPLALAPAAAKMGSQSDPENLWKLAGPLPDDALERTLASWLVEAAAAGVGEVLEAIGIGMSFRLPDQQALEFLQEYSLAFSQRTAAGSEEKIRKVLLQALAEGATIDQVRQQIEAVHTSLWRYESERIARTEIIRAHAEGQLSALRDLEVGSKQWLTADDERVCPICGPRDGHVYPIDDPVVSIPAHPHCRCTWLLPEAEFERLRAELLDLGWATDENDSQRGEGPPEDDEKFYTTIYRTEPTDTHLTPTAFAQKVQAEIAKGTESEADVRRIGALLRAEVLDRIEKIPAYQLAPLKDRVHPEILLEVLAEIRPLGGDVGQPWHADSRMETRSMVERVSEWLPTAWLELSANGPEMLGFLAAGDQLGGYNATTTPRGLRISWRNSQGNYRQLARSALHEFGHRLGEVLPRLRALEAEFYARRTKNDVGTVPLSPTDDTPVKPDQFAHRYMGKLPTKQGYYEVFTAGLESLFDHKYNLYEEDEDTADFLLGLLAAL